MIGLEYKSYTPWDAGKEIHEAVNGLKTDYDRIILIASSIDAYFSMNTNIEGDISHAFEQMQFLDTWLKNKLDS